MATRSLSWPPSDQISAIPPRQWAYGKFLLFGSAACIGAMDGGGKGMIATVMALAMITGYPLLGEKVWRTGPVAIISYEDDQDEWERRIAAACLLLWQARLRYGLQDHDRAASSSSQAGRPRHPGRAHRNAV